MGQVVNLRRIVNPPAALGRARRAAAGNRQHCLRLCRYAGQAGILRRVGNQVGAPPVAPANAKAFVRLEGGATEKIAFLGNDFGEAEKAIDRDGAVPPNAVLESGNRP